MDNVYHYRTPLDVVDFAHNLRLPRLLRLTVLNINLHRVHHHEPHLPWWRLHARFRERADRYDAAYLPAALGQLRGPVPVAALAAARAAPREAA
jgi:fatty acid desaturase